MPNPRVMDWAGSIAESDLFLSVLTLGEIRRGIILLPQGTKRNTLERWLHEGLPVRFQNRILPVDTEIAQLWGSMIAQAKQARFTLPTVDSLLAATALHFKLTLVTRNIKDFYKMNVPILNPWESPIS